MWHKTADGTLTSVANYCQRISDQDTRLSSTRGRKGNWTVISVVGPEDSIDLVRSVAKELGILERFGFSAYQSPEEAPLLAKELDPISDVILFTGIAPFELSRASGDYRAELTYISHGATDLYRAVAGLLLDPEFRRVPVFSVDAVAPETVDEVLKDLGLHQPFRVIPLDLGVDREAFRPESLADAHERVWRTGEIELCLTCVASVHEQLRHRGVPTVRVAQTRPALRDTLLRVCLWQRLSLAEGQQLAVGVVRMRKHAGSGQENPARLHETAKRCAQRIGGTLWADPGGEVIIHAARGPVQRHLAPVEGNGSEALKADFGDQFVAGFGLGTSLDTARKQARQALASAEADGVPFNVFEDGIPVWRSDINVPASREPNADFLRRAHELGLAPPSLYKVLVALRQVPPAGFTAEDFAVAYGVTPRSSRRLIGSLQQVGILEVVGERRGPGAGRPKRVYGSRLERLVHPTGD